MKKTSLKIKDVQKHLDQKQLINDLVKKNLKGGVKCPPPVWD